MSPPLESPSLRLPHYLPDGGDLDTARITAFFEKARATRPKLDLPAFAEVRWIGLDPDTTEQIIELIKSGKKTGTFTLPWIAERTRAEPPQPGLPLICIDFSCQPRLVVRLTDVETVPFGDITEEHTAIDGPPVRPLDIWKPLHTQYWNSQLAPFGLTVSEAMPVWIEPFELVYAEA